MKKYIILLTMVLSLGACKKELDTVNPNVIVAENFWKTEGDFQSALAATYKVFHDVNNGYWGVRGVELSNGRGDDFFIRNDVKDLYQLSTFTNTPSTGTPSSIFSGAYTGIFRANQIIENAVTAPITDDLKKQFTAEAQFIRALNYFILAINFGATPIITAVPKSQSEYFVKQSPEEDVWQQIVTDLQAAKAALPVSYPSEWVGKATQGAAIGYLGKAYLYMKKYPEAEAEFKLLLTAPFSYDLLPNYEDNFKPEFDNNKESLFEIQVQNVGGTNPWAGENASEALGVTTAQEFAPTEVAGWFEASATDKMFTEFQKEKTTTGDFDPRMYASIVWNYPGAMYYNRPFSEFKLVFGYSSMIRKYQNWWANNEQPNGVYASDINEKTMRFADVLLMLAEAQTMQDKVTDAYEHVNRVRTRAKLADLPAGYNQSQMMTEIRHQRMVEFFREGMRFYDLKRWGLLEEEIENSDKVGKEFFNLQRHEYFPIPQNEINTNPNIEQNPNW
ncbi:RagB/SusD family nutrient uptake outer membrane protein [Cytophagaceae bacterium YF14B1]|uniref:RagB/SusD family nutrient uptake outer membrane protein n=1 Tax=Xanthocytophaga flava TaxID=3048013 RepID=A0AAE3UCT3_9BACT|nr:RagB/SusD family nutrient uptake outer membrane protein [Xanthocytophaga flavus]MDJ1485164.1 RagB/SusD family nutrient uptake outer membrane protein [Xanthocytophaga flavus]